MILLLAACTQPNPPPTDPVPEAPIAPVKAPIQPSATRPIAPFARVPQRPDDPSDPLNTALQRIFDDASCMGPGARVEVYRNEDGHIETLYYHGSVTRCSHPPSAYYTPDGTPRDSVAEEPLTDDNRTHYADLHSRNRGASTLAETRRF